MTASRHVGMVSGWLWCDAGQNVLRNALSQQKNSLFSAD